MPGQQGHSVKVNRESSILSQPTCFIEDNFYLCDMGDINAKIEEAEEINAPVAKLVRRQTFTLIMRGIVARPEYDIELI